MGGPSEPRGRITTELIGVITVLLPFIGYPRTLNALAAINEVAPASKSGLQAGAHGDLAQFR